ncbi:MAG: phosphopyruvate hydratase [Methylacidiphilales bacterium]|nr:phosphopyruvate hydratase [Candidatus Methylacidiphilales bacterium]
MSIINSVIGLEILDSRGNPTVEAEIQLKSGAIGRASVPSGASTGSKEAVELRDTGSKRFAGRGVLRAVSHINTTIAKEINNNQFNFQSELDTMLIQLDGTTNKNSLGANALLAVSLAFARAQAMELGCDLALHVSKQGPMSMPMPMFNFINGGAHANNNLSIQEFMIIPVGAQTFSEAIQWGAEIFYALKKIINDLGYLTTVGDEGGFAPPLRSNQEALSILCQAVELAGYSLKNQIAFALDCASTEYYNENEKTYQIDPNTQISSEQHVDYLSELCNLYPIISIEDGMSELDIFGWKLLTSRLGSTTQLVGDDLFVTNEKIFQEGINQKLANAILIKVNQIGTLTETLNTIALAKKNSYKTIISHRSGETEDTFISDLAVGIDAKQIKTGSLSRTDRTAKYNQLLRLERRYKISLANDFK